MDSFSMSNSLSKGSIYESESFFKAYRNDAVSRLADGARPEAISNEEIHRGDEILQIYRVEDDAIHGGMGSVWRVHHQNWNTDLAMKRPQPRFFAEGSEKRKEEFIAECEHWINLGLHPNIVSCYYVREIGGVPTIFSEWMDGGSLKDAIQSGRLYEGTEEAVQERLLDVAIQTALGLAYSHEQGLIHQDVKPGNIMLSKDWQAKVTDFGLAKAQSQLSDGEKQVSSGYTLAYCPKEQESGHGAAAWMDVYAWALTVLEMYAGERLWATGAEAAEHAEALLSRAHIAPPEPVRLLLIRCLSDKTVDFSTAGAALYDAYLTLTGVPYGRVMPAAAADTAYSLNNRALSFIDLGMREEARMLFEKAMALDPDAALVRFNMDLMVFRRDWEWDEGIDAYRVMNKMRALSSYLADACLSGDTAINHEMLGELLLAMYAGPGAQAELSRAGQMTDLGDNDRTRLKARARQARRGWVDVPVRPAELNYGDLYFNTCGDTLALAWPEETTGEDGEFGVWVNFILYDLAGCQEIARRKIRHEQYFNRLFLEPDRILLYRDADECDAFDRATFEPLGTISGEPWLEPEGAEYHWPHVPIRDGLRALTPITEGQDEADWHNRTSTFTNITFNREASFGRSGLWVELPAAGLDENLHAVCTDDERRWLLVYLRPYTEQDKDSFFICDTDLYGHMPDYVVARAVSTMEQLSVQQRRRKALDMATAALDQGDTRCFDALAEAYALYPANPDDEWVSLNVRAGQLGVRKSLLGVHRTAEYVGHALMDDGDPLSYNTKKIDHAISSGCYLTVERQKDGARVGRKGREIVALWPRGLFDESARSFGSFRKATKAAWDPASKTAYLAYDGTLSAWDCSTQPATWRGAARFGLHIPDEMEYPWIYAREHFKSFVPDEERLWRLEPVAVDLNRAGNATVAIVHCEVMNIYGSERISEDYMGITGIGAIVVIDLRCMKMVGQVFYSDGKLIELENEHIVLGDFELAGISDDGSVMAWNSYSYGAQVWAFPEPGTMLRSAISYQQIDGVRRDGNALLTRQSVSIYGDRNQEIILDWQYGPKTEGDCPVEGMTEDEYYAAIGREKPVPAEDSDAPDAAAREMTEPDERIDASEENASTPDEIVEDERKAPQNDISASDRRELDRLKADCDDADAEVTRREKAFDREDARWNSPEREKLEADIQKMRDEIGHLSIFGFRRKKLITEELSQFERRIADWFVDRRESAEKLDEARKRAEAAHRAYDEFRNSLFGKERE